MQLFNQELCEYVFNPKRMETISKTYNLSHEDFQEMY